MSIASADAQAIVNSIDAFKTSLVASIDALTAAVTASIDAQTVNQTDAIRDQTQELLNYRTTVGIPIKNNIDILTDLAQNFGINVNGGEPSGFNRALIVSSLIQGEQLDNVIAEFQNPTQIPGLP